MLMPGLHGGQHADDDGDHGGRQAVALAKPRWMTIRKADSSIRDHEGRGHLQARLLTMSWASQPAAFGLQQCRPHADAHGLNSTTVPQGKPFCDCFQSITPMRGNSISATAAIIGGVVSKVVQHLSRTRTPAATAPPPAASTVSASPGRVRPVVMDGLLAACNFFHLWLHHARRR